MAGQVGSDREKYLYCYCVTKKPFRIQPLESSLWVPETIYREPCTGEEDIGSTLFPFELKQIKANDEMK